MIEVVQRPGQKTWMIVRNTASRKARSNDDGRAGQAATPVPAGWESCWSGSDWRKPAVEAMMFPSRDAGMSYLEDHLDQMEATR